MIDTQPARKRSGYEANILLLRMMRKRKMKGIELAKAAGLHKCSISRIICGRANPKGSTVSLLCSVLNCQPEEIGL